MDAKKMMTTKVKKMGKIYLNRFNNMHLNAPHPKESVKKKTFFQSN